MNTYIYENILLEVCQILLVDVYTAFELFLACYLRTGIIVMQWEKNHMGNTKISAYTLLRQKMLHINIIQGPPQ